MSRGEAFPFPHKWKNYLRKLNKAEFGALIIAVSDYLETGEEVQIPEKYEGYYESMLLDIAAMDKVKEKRRKAASDGGKSTQEKRRKQSEANEANTSKAKQTKQTEAKTRQDNIIHSKEMNNNTPNPSPSSLGAKGEDLEREKREAEERENREMWRGIQHVQLPKGCRYDKNLGPFEYRDAEGKRRYREGGPIVPDGFERRPYYDSVLTMCDGGFMWLPPQDVEVLGAVLVE